MLGDGVLNRTGDDFFWSSTGLFSTVNLSFGRYYKEYFEHKPDWLNVNKN